ncbi:MAG: Plasmid pRiA4b ORF-3-like protein [Firmicutes bacterium ADurb.Bin506]|jgi:hypothetical protein|nr:MAG: Plasmid pRiA4b ORF-3-like protein [Firmicutes bacterium ADurb.Bin506]
MLIQCTKALLDRVGINLREQAPGAGPVAQPLGPLAAWHAHLVDLDIGNAIVLMNDATRFPVVICGPGPDDFSRLKALIRDAIVVALSMEGVNEAIIDAYMTQAGEIEFARTANRSMVAKLKKAVSDISYVSSFVDENTLIQRYASIAAGRLEQRLPDGTDLCPLDETLKQLGREFGMSEDGTPRPVLDVELYQLKIQLEIDGFDIWRRVLVPSNFSFRHLHRVIQAVFDWQNYHLHLFEARGQGPRPKEIVMNDGADILDCFDPDQYDILQEAVTALGDIFPTHDDVIYEYDFGDSWIHTITLEGIVRSNAFEATYLEGNGERPPEDIGGPWGYIDYVRVMADPSDPEHESMRLWAKSQTAWQLTPEELQRKLRNCTSGFGE